MRTGATTLAMTMTLVLCCSLERAWAQEQLIQRAMEPQVQERLMRQNIDFLPPQQARPGEAIHEPFTFPITAAKIHRAIQDSLHFLRGQQRPDGSLDVGSTYAPGGPTALAALAMLAAGLSPLSDQTLDRALEWLIKLEPDNTYVRGIRANVWEYALRKVPYHKGYREALKKDFEWLMEALGQRDGWRYSMSSTDWDNSCTQYGVLGIWAASRAGFDPGEAFWKRMAKHFLAVQNDDGGWGYTTGGSSANMATAGLASLFLVFDMVHSKNAYSAQNPRTFTSGEAAKCLDALTKGMKWLGSTNSDKDNSYYLYGIERTGVASGRKYFGGEDWFKRGARTVLVRQAQDGSVNMGYSPVISTSFTTLFLVYGGAPVAFNKLEHGESQDWNLNPRDLANLSKHLWSAYERPLNWTSVSIDAPVAELEAPVLFISGSKAVGFSEEQVGKLREYLVGGGTILAEPSDHSEAFMKSMVELVGRLFPQSEYPAHRLEPLAKDHGVYTVLRQEWRKLPALRGVSDGKRCVFLLSEGYLSGDWQRNDVESDAFKLAMNLLFYATDLGELEGKFSSILPEGPAVDKRGSKVRVARVRYQGSGGYPRAWDMASVTWSRLRPYLEHVAGVELEEGAPVSLAGGDLSGIGLLHLSGHGAMEMTEAEGQALKGHVKAGGTLLVDAWGGDEAFAESARAAVEALFGELEPLDPADALASGRFQGGADLSRAIRLKLPARKMLRQEGQAPKGQHLEVARVGSRAAVIFSSFDLSAAVAGVEIYRSKGYRPDSARRIAANVLSYLAGEP